VKEANLLEKEEKKKQFDEMEASVSPELLQAIAGMMANALRSSITQTATEANRDDDIQQATQPKPQPFSAKEFRSSEGTSVEEYFKRFEWALQLSKIRENLHANYARVYMGTELNNALKFLVSPCEPDTLPYETIRKTLVDHFDSARNKYAESVKFRQISQQEGETTASFALRLKQGAAYCEYGEFLDRMLIEQFLHGLSDRNVCDEIIAKKPGTFSAAYEIAHALEATRRTSDAVKANGQRATTEHTHALLSTSLQTKQGKKLPHQRATSQHRKSAPRNTPRSRARITPQGNAQENTSRVGACNGCGAQHKRSLCPYKDAECYTCKRKGHIAKVCKSNSKRKIQDSTKPENPAEQVDTIKYLNRLTEVNEVNSDGKKMINVLIDGTEIAMELDSGSPTGIISRKTLHKIKSDPISLRPTDKQFMSYSHHPVKCIGRLLVNVTLKKITRKLYVYIVEDDHDSLFGRDWIAEFIDEINWTEVFSARKINSLTTSSQCLSSEQIANLEHLLEKYDHIFSDTAGILKGPPVKVHFKPGASPVFTKAREIPIALRDKYAKEIDAKIASGHYVRVEYSEWASTTHVVTKKDGNIRITGNYKPTLNPRIIIDEHPIPKPEHLFSKMKNAKIFCHLDITDAYTHLLVDEEFSHALTLNTPTHGLIRPTRAVYGAANIPAIWQRRLETVIQGLDNVLNFFDDILVFADTFENLMLALGAVLERLKQYGLRLNRKKCVFAAPTVEFLGHKIDAQGVHKSDRHIEAIRDAPKPSTPDELELFLGKATYYNSFIPSLSTRARPLRDMLLAKPFKWTPSANQAYTEIKNILISPQVLMPYDPSLPLLLATDASKTGLDAVLSHRLSSGEERPIAYASRTMTATEQRYPQIDKEALAIVWAVQKFFHYLYARHFTLITDHKPLTQILHPEKSLPVLCISRMANYADLEF